MPIRTRIFSIATCVLAFACSDEKASGSGVWGDACSTEREGRYAYDVATPEQSCVDLINDYRAEVGQPPLARWSDGESCAVTQASADAAADDAHGSFGDCGESAQNTCPSWRSVDAVLGGCLLGMYCEGPSPSGAWDNDHGHHMNMVNSRITKVACGFYQQSDGRYWVNVNFR